MNINILSEFPPLPDLAAAHGTEEIFEWIALLESVAAAKTQFTMVELGAGYGRWTARASLALRVRHPGIPAHYVVVEAEPSHFLRLQRHLVECGISLADCTLVQAPVSGKRETVYFSVGHPDEWYGQAIVPTSDHPLGDWPEAKTIAMEAVTIHDLIVDLHHVDLIDMDIQGAELACIENSLEILTLKCKRILIASHGNEIHRTVDYLMAKTGAWRCECSYPLQSEYQTEFGRIHFGDGMQYWVNRSLNSEMLSGGPDSGNVH